MCTVSLFNKVTEYTHTSYNQITYSNVQLYSIKYSFSYSSKLICFLNVADVNTLFAIITKNTIDNTENLNTRN